MHLSLTTRFYPSRRPGPTARRIADLFGLTFDDHRPELTLFDNLHIDLEPGTITFITGHSGCGKSTLIRLLDRLTPNALVLNRLAARADRPLPDCLPMPLERALYTLSLVGLADARLFLRTPRELSDGQAYRFKLAMALARKRDPKIILADEFTDTLDRVTATIIAANVRKAADRHAVAFVLASTKIDIARPLNPDIVIENGRRIRSRRCA